jgi:hypothetical protein
MKWIRPRPPGLSERGVRADHLGELVAPGVLEAADRHHLVELAVLLRKSAVASAPRLLQPPDSICRRACSTCEPVVLMR